jgi:hypothetical protein
MAFVHGRGWDTLEFVGSWGCVNFEIEQAKLSLYAVIVRTLHDELHTGETHLTHSANPLSIYQHYDSVLTLIRHPHP